MANGGGVRTEGEVGLADAMRRHRRVVVDENKAARLERGDNIVTITFLLVFVAAAIAWCIFGLRGHVRPVKILNCDCRCPDR